MLNFYQTLIIGYKQIVKEETFAVIRVIKAIIENIIIAEYRLYIPLASPVIRSMFKFTATHISP